MTSWIRYALLLWAWRRSIASSTNMRSIALKSGDGMYCLVEGISPSLQNVRAASTRLRSLFSENPSFRYALPERKNDSRASLPGVIHSILISWSTNPAPSRLNSFRAAFNDPSSSFFTTLRFHAFGRVGSLLRAAALNRFSGSGRAFHAPCAVTYIPAIQAIVVVPTSWTLALASCTKPRVIPTAAATIASPTNSRTTGHIMAWVHRTRALTPLPSRWSRRYGIFEPTLGLRAEKSYLAFR